MNSEMKKPGLGEGRADSETVAECDVTTQTGRLLQALRKRPMSSYEITTRLHIAHPASPIRDLRRRGHNISTEIHPHPSRPAERIKRYRLIESE